MLNAIKGTKNLYEKIARFDTQNEKNFLSYRYPHMTSQHLISTTLLTSGNSTVHIVMCKTSHYTIKKRGTDDTVFSSTSMNVVPIQENRFS